MLFETNWLATLFPENRGNIESTSPIQEVTTDSRVETTNALFIPLVGDQFDGHDHVKQAIDQGAVAMFWHKDKELPMFIPTDFPVFFVADTLLALQQLATYYRKKINPIVVGITGSNGKTTTKDLVASILKTTYQTHATKGNFNNHIGLPLTILAMSKHTEVLILEMGMSDFKEIERLSEIARPDYAIITNIGESHIEFLGSRQGIANAKLEIMHGLKDNGMMFIDGDEQLLLPLHQMENIVTCGYKENNNQLITNVEMSHHTTTFTLRGNSRYSVPLLGWHHALNATYAIALGKQLNVSEAMIQEGLHSLELTSMRFELLKGANDVSIINDAYNASPTSMKAAINVVKQMKGFKEKVLILGDIFELGNQSDDLHKSVASVIESPITTVFTYGEAARNISETVNKEQTDIPCSHFETKEELLDALKEYIHVEALLLFKASRGMRFETIVEDVLK